jgi:hypothetical protein
MGVPIIIAPINRWLQRYLPVRRPKESGQDDQIAYIRGVFEQADLPVAINPAPSEALDEGLNQLDPNLVESIFKSTAPSSRNAADIEREEYDESLPVTRPITKVSADATPDATSEGPNVEARQGKQSVARSDSTEVTQDSTREALDDGAVAETDNDVEPEEELPDLVDELLTSEVPVTDDALGLLTGDLKTIFRSKVGANPHTRRLIEKHGTVDAHELVNDLRSLVRSIEEVERR